MSEDISKQLNNIQSGTDKLKESLQALNKEVPEFADGMEAGLKAVAKALPDVITSMMQLNAQNKQLAAEGGKPVSILSQLASGMFSWNTAISVGTTLLVTYGGEIIKWAANMLKGETNMSALTKALNDQKIAMSALIASHQKGDQNAQQELVSLKLLYTATQNHKLSITERKRAVDQLQVQYPDYFKNLSDEAILAGKAKKAYTDLAGAIIASARAKAAEGMIVANQQRQLTNEQKLSDLTKQRAQTQKELAAAIKDHNAIENAAPVGGGATVAGTTNNDSYNPAKIDRLTSQLRAQDKTISDLNTDSKLLDAKNNVLTNAINQAIEKHGVDTLNKVGGDPSGDEAAQGFTTTVLKDSSKADKAKEEAIAAEKVKQESAARLTLLTLEGYAKEVTETNQHFDQLRDLYKGNNAIVEQLEKERVASIDAINKKFQNEGIEKLTDYEQQLRDIGETAGRSAKELAIKQLQDTYKAKDAILKKEIADANARIEVYGPSTVDDDIINRANKIKEQLESNLNKDKQSTTDSFDKAAAKEQEGKEEAKLQGSVNDAQQGGHNSRALQLQKQLLDLQEKAAIASSTKTAVEIAEIETKFAKKKADIENQLIESKIHAGDQYINAILKNTNKESAIYKAAFLAKKATSIADVIMSTKKSIIASFEGYSSMPFIGQALAIAQGAFIATQGAMSIATIAKQKPGFAQGGQFVSDGRGALLSGYSRTDNTNAYLRSGEAVVVSEAMRNPWARNLVSAINVAHGGRDFSIPNPGRGYAIGGIFTDGGNANRYYSQPMNDVKDLANTMAYQMLNNFPPIYVDVKDVNNQQNILAQTVNRVNL